MAQHRRITLKEVEDALDLMEHANRHDLRESSADLLRTLVLVDRFLVKHDQTQLARQLRRSFYKMVDQL